MVVTKPAEIRKEQKKYFNIAYQGEPVVVSRPRNENVVIISENEYRRMSSSNHLLAYYYKLTKSGSFDAQKDAEISDTLDNEMSYINSPYKSMSEKEFLEKIDLSLQEVHKGKVQDAFLAFDRICEEIESEAI